MNISGWLLLVCVGYVIHVEAVLFFQMEHTGRMNGIIYILLCRNLKKKCFVKVFANYQFMQI
jgi:hypothetical protein